MVSRVRIDRGDIVLVTLNPLKSQELQGDQRPCLVLTTAAYNAGGLAVIAPITQGDGKSRFEGFALTLMGTGTKTHGVVLCNQARSLDLVARRATRIERESASVVGEGLARVLAFFE